MTKKTRWFGSNCCGPPHAGAGRAVRAVVPFELGRPLQPESLHLDQCGNIDKPAAALVKDLKQRGMLRMTTLIVWGASLAELPCSRSAAATIRPRSAATTIRSVTPC